MPIVDFESHPHLAISEHASYAELSDYLNDLFIQSLGQLEACRSALRCDTQPVEPGTVAEALWGTESQLRLAHDLYARLRAQAATMVSEANRGARS